MTGEILPDYLRADRPAECLGHAKFIKNPRKLLYGRNCACIFFEWIAPPLGHTGFFFLSKTRESYSMDEIPPVNLRVDRPASWGTQEQFVMRMLKTRESYLMDQIPLVNLRLYCPPFAVAPGTLRLTPFEPCAGAFFKTRGFSINSTCPTCVFYRKHEGKCVSQTRKRRFTLCLCP